MINGVIIGSELELNRPAAEIILKNTFRRALARNSAKLSM
jgi:hypothetical protein